MRNHLLRVSASMERRMDSKSQNPAQSNSTCILGSEKRSKSIPKKRAPSPNRKNAAKRVKFNRDMSEKFFDLFGSNSPPPPLPLQQISNKSSKETAKSTASRPLISRIQFADEVEDLKFIKSKYMKKFKGKKVECIDNAKNAHVCEKPCPKSKKKNMIIIGNKNNIIQNIQDEETTDSQSNWDVKNREMAIELKVTNDNQSDKITKIQITKEEESSSVAINDYANILNINPIIVKSEFIVKPEVIESHDNEYESMLPFNESISDKSLIDSHETIQNNKSCDQDVLEKSSNNDTPKLILKPIQFLLHQDSFEKEKAHKICNDVQNTITNYESSHVKAPLNNNNTKLTEQMPREILEYYDKNLAFPYDAVSSLAEYILALMREREKYKNTMEDIEKFSNKDMILEMKINAQNQLAQNENYFFQQTLKYFQPQQMYIFKSVEVMKYIKSVTKSLADKTHVIESFDENVYADVLNQIIDKAHEYFNQFLAMTNKSYESNIGLDTQRSAENIQQQYNANNAFNFQQTFINTLRTYRAKAMQQQQRNKNEAQSVTSTNSFISNNSVPVVRSQYPTSATDVNKLYSYVNSHERCNEFLSEFGSISNNNTHTSHNSTATNIPAEYMYPTEGILSKTKNPPTYESTITSRTSLNNESVYSDYRVNNAPKGIIMSPNYSKNSVHPQYKSRNTIIYKQSSPSAPTNVPLIPTSLCQADSRNQYDLPNQIQCSPSNKAVNTNYYAVPPIYQYANKGTYQTHKVMKINPSAPIQQYRLPNTLNTPEWGSGEQVPYYNGLPNGPYEDQRIVNRAEYGNGSFGLHQSEADVRVTSYNTCNDKLQGWSPSTPLLPEQARSISRDSGFMSPTAAGTVLTQPIDSTRLIAGEVLCKCTKGACVSCKCAKAQVDCTSSCKCGGHQNKALRKKETVRREKRKIPVIEHPKKKCRICEKFTTLRCTVCLNVYYCSTKCQEIDWNLHQFLCSNRTGSN